MQLLTKKFEKISPPSYFFKNRTADFFQDSYYCSYSSSACFAEISLLFLNIPPSVSWSLFF